MRFPCPLTLPEILNIIGNTVPTKGNATQDIVGINEFHSVTKGEITFVDCEKYYKRVLSSDASVVLIDKDIECPEGKTLIITDDPLRDYLAVVQHFAHFNPQSETVHPDAQIGEGTVVQPLVFIGEHVKIGKNCIIHSNVSIYGHATIGDNVIIHANSTIGADACYFQRRQTGWIKLTSCGDVAIGNNVEVGSNCCIDRGVSGTTHIGDGCKFDNLVQIGHDAYIGKNVLLGAQSAIAGCTYVDDDCVIWAKACVNKDLYVAKRTTLNAYSAIGKSVMKEDTTLFGIPATDATKKMKELVYTKNLSSLFKDVEELKKILKNDGIALKDTQNLTPERSTPPSSGKDSEDIPAQ